MLATGSEWRPLERSLPVVNWELLERSLPIVNWEPLERSLPVVNWEPVERSLAVVNWELLERSLAVVNWEPLERSLPVVNWEALERSLPVVSVLRVPPESSTQGSSCVFAGVVLRRTQDLGWSSDSKTPQVQSLPVVSVLTGSDGRSLLERSI